MMETNVVVARFTTEREAMTARRHQWDYGQKLKIEGIADLPNPFEVHFSNTSSVGTAKVWIGQEGVVDIPDEYLTNGAPVYAWIYLHAGETDGETVYRILIPVKKRPKPVNDTPTPTQKSELDTAIAILQTASATATEQAGIAQNAATTATEAATRAEGAVDAVEAAATRAETAARGAEASATAAEASATDAESAKTAALAAKGAAETAAASAEQSATDAGNYARLAEAAEQDAQAAKTAAETSATAAAASATQAGQSASDAQTAKTDAETAQTAAEAAKDTAVANATTATTKAAEAAQSASSASDSETAAEAAATRAEQAAASLTVDNALSETSENPVQNKVVTGAVTQLKDTLAASQIVNSASGAIASFSDGANNIPVRSLSIDLEPIQDLHGYDHPWPAGGGKNLLPLNVDTIKRQNGGASAWNGNSYTTNGITYTLHVDETGVIQKITANGTATAGALLYIISNEVSVVIGSSIIVTIPGVSAGRLQYDNKWIDLRSASTTVENVSAVQSLWLRINNGVTVNNVDCSPMIRLSSETDSTFAPYSNICPISGHDAVTVTVNSTDYTTDLPTTVYGGTLDVVSGELLVDRAMVDLGSLDWTGEDSFSMGMARATVGVADLGAVYFQTLLCSTLKGTPPKSYSQVEMGTVCFSNSPSAPFIRVRSQIFSGLSDAEIKTALTGVQIVYELATPQTYHLTPQEVRTLLGMNNVWSDADSVSVDYVADPKLYIDSLTEPDADMIADANIVSGQYFMVSNTLYFATANIASGAAITPGVNCTRTSLAAALNAINA